MALAWSALLLCGLGSGTATAARWTIQPTANLGVAHADLTSVSCTSGTNCTAVGSSFRDDPDLRTPLVARWNGLDWSIEPRAPTRVRLGELFDISCTSGAACTAVGELDTNGGSTLPLVERWNGSAWSLQHVPRPFVDGSRDDASLTAVSCTSSTACTAVGSDDDSSQPLAERWNGSKWSIERIPHPNLDGGDLVGLSCTSKTTCIAVGSYLDEKTGCTAPLVEQSTGDRWSMQPSANLPDCGFLDSTFTGVSCTSGTTCRAVGFYSRSQDAFDRTLAEQRTAGLWSIQPTPGVSYRIDPWGGGSGLDDVACTSRVACVAVGGAGSDLKSVPIAERWNGTRWMLSIIRAVRDGELLGVSCTSPVTCTGVGFTDNGTFGSDHPFVERLG